MQFVLSGEDQTLGGGIYWRENEKKGKNTCVNAPAIVAAAELYQITRDQKYLETAKRLYSWTRAHLQDPQDGLYYDNIGLGGNVAKFKLTYNSGLMIRANVELYRATGDMTYLNEARRIANSSINQWFIRMAEFVTPGASSTCSWAA